MKEEQLLHEGSAFIRRSCNFLPCMEEVRFGIIFDSYGRAGRDSPMVIGALTTIFY